MIRASIVVATYNRPEPLKRLLGTLAKQKLPRDEFEVVVVDDGSTEDATPIALSFSAQLQVSMVRQANAGVAVARQRGVERARAPIVVFLDDDMLVYDDFIERHLDAHAGRENRVVMGELLPAERVEEMPLFERFHAHQLANMAARHGKSGTFAGPDVYTGNLSLPRDLFLRAGGFDPAFFIEDVELGVRLEKLGAEFVFSREATAVHASDHTSLEKWLARSELEGREWVRLARKHPQARAANPWRFFAEANPLSRSFYAMVIAVPKTAPALARIVFRGAASADALGLDDVTVSAMTLVYGIEYFRGVREETGSLFEAVDDYYRATRHRMQA